MGSVVKHTKSSRLDFHLVVSNLSMSEETIFDENIL